MIEIKRRGNGEVILRVPTDTLAGADLRGAQLPDADLRKADLQGADLTGADIRDGNLSRAKLHGANLTDAILENVNLGSADLSGAMLLRANLTSAKLVHSNLTGADLSFADLTSTDIRGACLVDTKLDSTNFGSQLCRARDDALTDWGNHTPPWASRHPRQGIEIDQYEAWNAIIVRIVENGLIQPGVCPSCGQAQLQYFFWRHRLWDLQQGRSTLGDPDRGGFWIWCPACYRSDHASVRVPTWWQDVLEWPEDLRT